MCILWVSGWPECEWAYVHLCGRAYVCSCESMYISVGGYSAVFDNVVLRLGVCVCVCVGMHERTCGCVGVWMEKGGWVSICLGGYVRGRACVCMCVRHALVGMLWARWRMHTAHSCKQPPPASHLHLCCHHRYGTTSICICWTGGGMVQCTWGPSRGSCLP